MKTHAPRILLAVAALLLPIRAGADDLYVSVGFDNTIVKFTPDGAQSVFASGLSNPWGLAFDYAGNLYAANRDSNNIMKFTPGGVGTVFATTSTPWGLAFDSGGNLFVSKGDSTIVKFSPDGLGSSVFASTGLNFPTGLAFDHAGNLFAANTGNDTIQKFTPGGAGTFFANTSPSSSPYGLAVDRANNLYATNSNNNTIQKFTPGGVGSVFATSGLSNPFAAAFDSAGNFYTGNYFGGAIREFTPDGTGSTFATAPSVPHFMAFTGGPVKAVRAAGFATAIPGGTGNFTSLPSAPGYSSSGAVAFYGAGSGGQQGIYRMQNGPPIKVADLNTAIPSGTGNFTAFFGNGPPIIPAIEGSNVAFFGAGSGGQQGVYVSMTGPPIRIADTATAIPGGSGNFTAFTQAGVAPSPVLSGSKAAFFGAGAGGQQGLYAYDFVAQVGPPIKIADTATLIPGGTGAFTAFPQHPSLSGDNVAFLGTGTGGQQGVYRAGVSGPPIKVADLNTAIPSGTGNFTAFIPQDPVAPAGVPSIAGNNVAFFGAGSGGQQGIYVSQSGPPIRIADTATAIPGGTGLFTSFGDVSLSATDVAFLGFGASGQGGIYDMTGGSLVEVIGLGDILNGRTITGLNLSRTGLYGDPVAFEATFADGSQGIYTANIVPEPGAALLCGFGALAFAGARRRRGRAHRGMC